MTSAMTFLQTARELEESGVAFVVVTMVSARGHAPQDPGAKAIVTADGIHWGTVGGGKVEARAIVHARQMIEGKTSNPELIVWNLQRDIGMTCGGEVTYLFEHHSRPSWKIAVFGAGHVAQALVRALEPLECSVICVDARKEWVDRLPSSTKLQALCEPDPRAIVEKLSEDTSFVVMTQGHATDVPILEAIFGKFPNARYVGVIGSDVKALKIKSELRARGVTEELVARLRTPIGLPIGSNHPAEIAISIVAELLQVRDSSLKA